MMKKNLHPLHSIFNKNSVFGINKKNKCDGLCLLKNIPSASLKVIFFDPQYRGILDKLSYGNEGALRGKARSKLPQMSMDTICSFLNQIERILLPNGYLFLWIDKFHLIEGIQNWFTDLKTLQTVDMIVWNKLKIGMGYRTRRKCEYLIIIQKFPRQAKSTWRIHNIPDIWEERVSKNHPHSKPIELQKQIILSTTQEDDFICDPAAGGYSVLEACKQTNRNFIGCDIEFGEEKS